MWNRTSAAALCEARIAPRCDPLGNERRANHRPGVKGQENQSRSKDRYLSHCQGLKSLQTMQMTAGEQGSHWSYTFLRLFKSNRAGRVVKGDWRRQCDFV
jgi:hypothetical protein